MVKYCWVWLRFFRLITLFVTLCLQCTVGLGQSARLLDVGFIDLPNRVSLFPMRMQIFLDGKPISKSEEVSNPAHYILSTVPTRKFEYTISKDDLGRSVLRHTFDCDAFMSELHNATDRVQFGEFFKDMMDDLAGLDTARQLWDMLEKLDNSPKIHAMLVDLDGVLNARSLSGCERECVIEGLVFAMYVHDKGTLRDKVSDLHNMFRLLLIAPPIDRPMTDYIMKRKDITWRLEPGWPWSFRLVEVDRVKNQGHHYAYTDKNYPYSLRLSHVFGHRSGTHTAMWDIGVSSGSLQWSDRLVDSITVRRGATVRQAELGLMVIYENRAKNVRPLGGLGFGLNINFLKSYVLDPSAASVVVTEQSSLELHSWDVYIRGAAGVGVGGTHLKVMATAGMYVQEFTDDTGYDLEAIGSLCFGVSIPIVSLKRWYYRYW